MSQNLHALRHAFVVVTGLSLVLVLLAWGTSVHARVTRIVIDRTATLTGQDIPYETITGRAFGELDPNDSQNALITDIALAPRNPRGKVEYIATFFIVKPVDMSQASGLMWHDVPNRGGRITITTDLRNSHDVGLSSGWQGDNTGATVVPSNASVPTPVPPSTNEWVKTPVLVGVTGQIFGRIDHSEASGVPTNAPPPIRHVIKMLVPRVDADGNELGGVPTVLRDAPLGTYLGWNITSGPGDAFYDSRPFHAGQVCNYVGGMVPFAKTKAQRLAAGDPRLSLEERYGTHDRYVKAVKAAADNAACKGYLLAGPAAAAMGAKCTTSIPNGFPDDWAALVNAAMTSNVCNQLGDGGKCNPLAP